MNIRRERRWRLATDILVGLLVAVSLVFAWWMRDDWMACAFALYQVAGISYMGRFLHLDSLGYERRERERRAAAAPRHRLTTAAYWRSIAPTSPAEGAAASGDSTDA